MKKLYFDAQSLREYACPKDMNHGISEWIFFILLCFLLIGLNLIGYSLFNSMADETEHPVMEKYYTSVEIHRGDSLWSIAETYKEGSHMTTAEYVKELKAMNGLKGDTIHSGQYLTVMYFVETDRESP